MLTDAYSTVTYNAEERKEGKRKELKIQIIGYSLNKLWDICIV